MYTKIVPDDTFDQLQLWVMLNMGSLVQGKGWIDAIHASVL